MSGCTHTDRELHLVPKKGRPVTQCSHCRLERKKRSAHVSCQCGETDKQPSHSREKCIHLREAEERAKAGLHDISSDDKDPAHLTAVAEEQGCCCSHGGKCSCASLKHEPLVLDGLPRGPAVKPRLESTRSDGSITVFQNGHHKPVHRKNHAAHECGMPYKMPLPRANTEHCVQKAARRSVDSLALNSNLMFNHQAFASQSTSPFNSDRPVAKSEQPSPDHISMDTTSSILGDANVSSMDFSNLGLVPTNQSLQSATSERYAYLPFEPLSAMTDEGYNPWSVLPSADSTGMPNNNPFGVWATNPDMSMAQPALTAASSGTQSEIDEIPAMEDMYGGFGMPSIQEDASFTFNGTQGPTSPQSNRHSLPPNFFSPSDFMSGVNGDWSNMTEGFPNMVDSKPKSSEHTPSSDMDDAWQMPYRALGAQPAPGRPASQSVGPSSAPTTDIMHQLFPDMDSMFTTKTTATTATPPLDFGPMDSPNVDFADHAWSDGSMTVPADTFTAAAAAVPFDMSQDFASPDFPGTWPQ